MSGHRPSSPTKAQLLQQVAALQSENEILRETMAELPRLDANLKVQLAAYRATLPPPPPTYVAIKAIDSGGYCIDTLKYWGRRGWIDTKRIGARWLATQASVDALIQQLRGR
jgi:hypothetical protein